MVVTQIRQVATFGAQVEHDSTRSVPVEPDNIGGLLRPLINQFDRDLGYEGAIPSDDLDSLLRSMHAQAAHFDVPYPEHSRSHQAFKVGLYYAHLCFPNHPLDIRVYVGIFTWIAVIVDDESSRNPKEWENFFLRFQTGVPQPSPLAGAWAEHLRSCYKYYSPLVANFIVTASLNYTNANALQVCEVPRMTRTAGGESWPYYLREKDGMAEAYAWFTFPKERYPDVSRYVEAIGDMNKYLALTNDILSFYKEEKAGEKHNYVHNRAFYEGRDVYDVLQDVIREVVAAHRRVQIVLGGNELYAQAWHEHAMGYVTMHKSQERYRLWELGLGEKYTDDAGRMTSLRQVK